VSAALDRKLRQAAAALAAGDLARAGELSREVLERAPRHPRALELAATVCLRQEDGAGAGALLERALAADPDNRQLLEGLGVAALKAGKPTEAEAWLKRAMAGPGAGAMAPTWLGLALSAQGRHTEAIEAFRRAAVATPDDPGVHLNLGHELMKAGEWSEAAASYQRALRLRPDYAEALNALGSVLMLQGDAEAAIARFREATGMRPDYAEAHDNLGAALLRLDRLAEAEASIQRAISVAPDNADYQADLGHLYFKREQWELAIAQYRRALALRPDTVETLMSLGSALIESRKPDAALEPIRRAILLQSDSAEAHESLATALLHLGREPEANDVFRRAIVLKPGVADRHFRFGNALKAQQRWDEAVEQFELALALDPGHADAHYSLSFVQLFRHEFAQAWAGFEQRFRTEDYRKRSFRKDPASVRLFDSLPRWRGPAEAGVRDVAIWAEQGVGDQVMYSTQLPALIETGVRFTYELDARLLAAYQRAFPGQRFVAIEDPPHEALQGASRIIAAGSLATFFRHSISDFSRQPAKLLGALPQKMVHYREQLAALGPGLKVALSWMSTRKDWWVSRKTTRLAQYASLLALPGVHFVDVQYGETAAERRELELVGGARLTHFEGVDLLNDLEELFAILEASDLVITPSNATAHFAGALGKRTWLLFPADRSPFPYWAHGGSHRCHWYPSVEIVTAPDLESWDALLAHVRDKLRRELAGPVSNGSPAR
jgi:tetratricopeptide (TPR) repeat protein